MGFPIVAGHRERENTSRPVLKIRTHCLGFDSYELLLEDRQSGVDGGFVFHQIACTNITAGRMLSRATLSNITHNFRNFPYNRYS